MKHKLFFGKFGKTAVISGLIFASIGTSSAFASTNLIGQIFTGRSNAISDSTRTSGYHTFGTFDSAGKFSCRLTLRNPGSDPDKIISIHSGNKKTLHLLNLKTYYIRYEGASNNARTIARLDR